MGKFIQSFALIPFINTETSQDKIFVKFTIHFFTIQHLIVGGLLMVRDDFTQSEFIHKIRIKGARVWMRECE